MDTTKAGDFSVFGTISRASHLRRQLARMTEELSAFPSFVNPISKGTIDATAIEPGDRVILVGFEKNPMLRPIEFTGYIRRHHDKLLFADTTIGSIDLVANGAAPDAEGVYRPGFAAFPDTVQGRSDARSFLYRISSIEEINSGELVYPNAGKTIKLLESYDKRKFVAQKIDYDYLEEDPRTRSDFLS